MTYSVLKVPLNPNQPTNLLTLQQKQLQGSLIDVFKIINRFDNDMLFSRIDSRVHIVAKAIRINYSSAMVLSMWKFTEDWRVKFATFHEKQSLSINHDKLHT